MLLFSEKDLSSPCLDSLFHIIPNVLSLLFAYPSLGGNYMFKVNNRNISARCEICSKLTIKTPERCHWRRSGVFFVNFGNILHLLLVFLLLTFNM